MKKGDFTTRYDSVRGVKAELALPLAISTLVCALGTSNQVLVSVDSVINE